MLVSRLLPQATDELRDACGNHMAFVHRSVGAAAALRGVLSEHLS